MSTARAHRAARAKGADRANRALDADGLSGAGPAGQTEASLQESARQEALRGGGRSGFTALAADLSSGRLPLLAYVERLEALFAQREPELLAFLPEPERFERLRREAGALVARYPRPASRPPLFGIALGVKDIFHLDGWPTRAGSRLPPDELAGPEASSARTLKRAGALVLGKTVTTEFAYFAPGPTRNPRHPGHTPGGSSSGSAAAVGAGLCPLALGSQTIGSIMRPAGYCGVVGFKPSYGRIATAGVVPLAPSLDHVGVLASEVAAARVAASLLCRGWRPAAARHRYRRRPVRLGIPEGPYLARASAAALASFATAGERLAAAGFEVEAVPALLDFEEVVSRHLLLFAAEAARVHASWYQRHARLYDARTAALIERGRSAPAAEVARARAGRARLRRDLEALMDSRRLDFWISPSAPGPAPSGLDSTGDPVMNLPWTYCGLPVLGLPAGESAEGLPMGLQVAARFDRDERLLAWGSALESACRGGAA